MNKQMSLIIAGIFGNALEWYDFTAYAFFAPLFASLFFPTKNSVTSLLISFGVFALGFLVRPIGGIIFGYIGDHFGRKKALILSIIVMSVPTFLVGCLPVYEAIGLAAPILLTALRLIQGTAVSGELTTATTFLVEHAASNKRGFAGSLAMGSAFIGITLSSAVATVITETLTPEHLTQFGWRLPFLLGGVLGIIGLIYRLRTVEPILYAETVAQTPTQEMPNVVKHIHSVGYLSIAMAIFLTCIMAVGNYFTIAYFNTFLIKDQKFPMESVMLINLICLFANTLLIPVMGMLSDKFGRKPILATAMIGLIFVIHPVFWLLTKHSLLQALLGEMLFIIFVAPIAALIPTTLAEIFHVRVRNSGISIGYNISLALFGGTAPLVAIYLVERTGDVFAPTWYVIGCALVSLIALFYLEESYQKQLH